MPFPEESDFSTDMTVAPVLASDGRHQGGLQVRAPQPAHRLELRRSPGYRILAHAPQQLAQRLLALRTDRCANCRRRATYLVAPHLVHRRVGQHHDMKAVLADPGVGQRLADPVGVGCASCLCRHARWPRDRRHARACPG